MALTESQWRSLQSRAVDPFASYDSDIVNRHLESLTLNENCILTGLYPTIVDQTNIKVPLGFCVKDNVLIRFTQDIAIDLTDVNWYSNPASGGLTTTGIYYVVVSYRYQQVKPAPYAKVVILNDPSTQYDPGQYLFLAALQIDTFTTGLGVISVIDHDPLNTDIERKGPGLLSYYKGKKNWFASLDDDGLIPSKQLGIDDTTTGPRVLWSAQKVSDAVEEVKTEALNSVLTTAYDAYLDWCLESRYQSVTCDAFVNTDIIDLANTNCTIDSTNHRIVGLAGEVFQSLNLATSDITNIPQASFATKANGSINWFLSCDGGVTWEPITLDENNVSDNYTFTSSGNDLRVKAVFVSDGVIYSYGVLYNLDVDWTKVDVADASNAITWSLPKTTLISGSVVEFVRFQVPSNKTLYIKKLSLYRADDGPPITGLDIVVKNVSDNLTLVRTNTQFDDSHLYIVPQNKIISITVENTSPSDLDIFVFITGVIGDAA